jgi:F0F1-type ATP synthase assembly protein I
MNRVTLYNSIVLIVALICFAYSVVVAFLQRWYEANYFLLLALFVYLVFLHRKK